MFGITGNFEMQDTFWWVLSYNIFVDRIMVSLILLQAFTLKRQGLGSYSHFLDHKRPTRSPRVNMQGTFSRMWARNFFFFGGGGWGGETLIHLMLLDSLQGTFNPLESGWVVYGSENGYNFFYPSHLRVNWATENSYLPTFPSFEIQITFCYIIHEEPSCLKRNFTPHELALAISISLSLSISSPLFFSLLSLSLSWSIHPSIYLSIYLSTYISIYLSIYLSISSPLLLASLHLISLDFTLLFFIKILELGFHPHTPH